LNPIVVVRRSNIRRLVLRIRLQRLIVKSDNQEAAISIAESECTFHDLCNIRRIGGVEPSFHLDVETLTGALKQLINVALRGLKAEIVRVNRSLLTDLAHPIQPYAKGNYMHNQKEQTSGRSVGGLA
jgi:hypothetical protein